MLLTILTKLILSLLIVLVIPGFFLLLALFGHYARKISSLEKLVYSFALSLTATNLLMLLLGFFDIPLTRLSLLGAFLAFSLGCGGYYYWKKSQVSSSRKQTTKLSSPPPSTIFSSLSKFSYRQIVLFGILLLLLVSLRGFYLSRGIIPQTTDLGHHVYWTKLITQTGELPNYGMPDFIIGEHLPMAAVGILSGIDFISAFPVLVLFWINIFSLLATAVLVFEIVQSLTSRYSLWPKRGFFLALLIGGVFYAISSPQAKFVSGGVVGNVTGNLFIPLIFLLLLKIWKTRRAPWASLLILSGATLAYTHHLSSFIFLYSLLGIIITSSATILLAHRGSLKKFWETLKKFLAPFFAPSNLLLLLGFFLMLFFIWTPSYLNPEAVDTAVGTPIKSTRTGFSLSQIMLSVGAWNFFYGGLGGILLTLLGVKWLTKRKAASLDLTSDPSATSKNNSSFLLRALFALAVILGWAGAVFLMSNQPDLTKVDIPSRRIVSYFTYPLIVLSSVMILLILEKTRGTLSRPLWFLVFSVLLMTGLLSGLGDLSESARSKEPKENQQVMQTYRAAQYLKERLDDEVILKDHNYLEGDSWMKIFFMRDYEFPLSRGLLKRYEDPLNPRETCTRDMISIPESEEAKACFAETGVEYIVLKKGYDTANFENSPNFSPVYVSNSVMIFKRN